MGDPSIAELVAELAEGESRLARRCRNDPAFHQTAVRIAEALEDFYARMDARGDALQSFRRKLRRWVEHSPQSYVGFWGELHVAYWLSQHDVPHRFVDETRQSQTADLELVGLGRKVCLEVKALQPSPYEWFAERLLEEIGSFLPNRGIGVEYLRLVEARREALVAKAVQVIRERWLACPYSPVEYNGEEGEFSILLPVGGGVVSSWPGSRVRDDGTAWLESKLVAALRDGVGQFSASAPAFVVWVSFDRLLPDIESHVRRVLEQHGADFVHVAGVIILDPFVEWDLAENRSCCRYEELKREGLFEAIRAFRDR